MTTCLICDNQTKILGTVDLNKSCLDVRNKRIFPKSRYLIEYEECENCGLIFSPEMCEWPKEKFSNLIYNKEYIKVDKDYLKLRAENCAADLIERFNHIPLSHLDYGGGNGYMSKILVNYGWNSVSWDPFVPGNIPDKKFDLITAIEVLEHHPSPKEFLENVTKYMGSTSVLLFTTLTSDDIAQPLKWWYLAPRNGHIVIYTNKALSTLFDLFDLKLFKIEDNNNYAAYKIKPKWL